MTDIPKTLSENAWVKLLSQISIPMLAFVGMFAWNDLRAQGEDIQQILRKVEVYEWRIQALEKKTAELDIMVRKR